MRRSILVSVITGAALIVGLGISAQAQSGHPGGSVSRLFVKLDTAHESSEAAVSAHVTATGELADANEAAEPTAIPETEPADTDADTDTDTQGNQDETDNNDDNGDNNQTSADDAENDSGVDD